MNDSEFREEVLQRLTTIEVKLDCIVDTRRNGRVHPSVPGVVAGIVAAIATVLGKGAL